MAVNLSPVAGAAAQFFDNSGNVLTGGKLYTYDAGTTTPAVAYTNSSGLTAQPNPIVLNAAGRVPDSGEIWLSDGVSYKFVLKDSNDVLIGTYDNLVGINSNFVNFTGEEETQTATQGQTVFTLTTLTYQPATNNLLVFVNGSKQIITDNYIETSSTVVTFVDGLNVGDVVDFCTATPINTNITTAASVTFTGFNGQEGNVQDLADNDGSDWVGFLPAGTGAVARSAQDKMRDFVSVLDFGATGDGTTDDTTAIQTAINSFTAGGSLYFPAGTYLVEDLSIIGKYIRLFGDGMKTTILKAKSTATYIINAGDLTDVQASQFQIDNISLNGDSVAGIIGLNVSYRHKWELSNSVISDCEYGVYELNTWLGVKSNCYFINNAYGLYLAGANHDSVHNSCTFTGANYGVYITTQVTGDVANIGLTFNSCDFEYNLASATGVYMDAPNVVYLNQCYFEEINTGVVCIFMDRGQAVVNGGWVNPSPAVDGVFASLSADTNVEVNNAHVLVNDTTKLMYSTGGTITYNNCYTEAIPTVLTPQFNLACVGFNNNIYNLVVPTGKQWTSQVVNGAAATTTTSETSKTITCTNIGTSGAIGLYSDLDQSYRPSNNMYLCITYSTNSSNFKFYLNDTHFAGTQEVYSLPNTSGNIQTALILNEDFGASNALLYAEIIGSTLSVSDTFTLYNCKLSDYRYRTDTLLNISL